ncbi:unnamed protein product [Amoebophrya sp. A120]|nr:unnamed protein product [Amoebophrya sp. A120]|eukprot:GSA120T00001906001.1
MVDAEALDAENFDGYLCFRVRCPLHEQSLFRFKAAKSKSEKERLSATTATTPTAPEVDLQHHKHDLLAVTGDNGNKTTLRKRNKKKTTERENSGDQPGRKAASLSALDRHENDVKKLKAAAEMGTAKGERLGLTEDKNRRSTELASDEFSAPPHQLAELARRVLLTQPASMKKFGFTGWMLSKVDESLLGDKSKSAAEKLYEIFGARFDFSEFPRVVIASIKSSTSSVDEKKPPPAVKGGNVPGDMLLLAFDEKITRLSDWTVVPSENSPAAPATPRPDGAQTASQADEIFAFSPEDVLVAKLTEQLALKKALEEETKRQRENHGTEQEVDLSQLRNPKPLRFTFLRQKFASRFLQLVCKPGTPPLGVEWAFGKSRIKIGRIADRSWARACELEKEDELLAINHKCCFPIADMTAAEKQALEVKVKEEAGTAERDRPVYLLFCRTSADPFPYTARIKNPHVVHLQRRIPLEWQESIHASLLARSQNAFGGESSRERRRKPKADPRTTNSSPTSARNTSPEQPGPHLSANGEENNKSPGFFKRMLQPFMFAPEDDDESDAEKNQNEKSSDKKTTPEKKSKTTDARRKQEDNFHTADGPQGQAGDSFTEKKKQDENQKQGGLQAKPAGAIAAPKPEPPKLPIPWYQQTNWLAVKVCRTLYLTDHLRRRKSDRATLRELERLIQQWRSWEENLQAGERRLMSLVDAESHDCNKAEWKSEAREAEGMTAADRRSHTLNGRTTEDLIVGLLARKKTREHASKMKDGLQLADGYSNFPFNISVPQYTEEERAFSQAERLKFLPALIRQAAQTPTELHQLDLLATVPALHRRDFGLVGWVEWNLGGLEALVGGQEQAADAAAARPGQNAKGKGKINIKGTNKSSTNKGNKAKVNEGHQVVVKGKTKSNYKINKGPSVAMGLPRDQEDDVFLNRFGFGVSWTQKFPRVVVTKVLPDSVAAGRGLQPGDVLVKAMNAGLTEILSFPGSTPTETLLKRAVAIKNRADNDASDFDVDDPFSVSVAAGGAAGEAGAPPKITEHAGGCEFLFLQNEFEYVQLGVQSFSEFTESVTLQSRRRVDDGRTTTASTTGRAANNTGGPARPPLQQVLIREITLGKWADRHHLQAGDEIVAVNKHFLPLEVNKTQLKNDRRELKMNTQSTEEAEDDENNSAALPSALLEKFFHKKTPTGRSAGKEDEGRFIFPDGTVAEVDPSETWNQILVRRITSLPVGAARDLTADIAARSLKEQQRHLVAELNVAQQQVKLPLRQEWIDAEVQKERRLLKGKKGKKKTSARTVEKSSSSKTSWLTGLRRFFGFYPGERETDEDTHPDEERVSIPIFASSGISYLLQQKNQGVTETVTSRADESRTEKIRGPRAEEESEGAGDPVFGNGLRLDRRHRTVGDQRRVDFLRMQDQDATTNKYDYNNTAGAKRKQHRNEEATTSQESVELYGEDELDHAWPVSSGSFDAGLNAYATTDVTKQARDRANATARVRRSQELNPQHATDNPLAPFLFLPEVALANLQQMEQQEEQDDHRDAQEVVNVVDEQGTVVVGEEVEQLQQEDLAMELADFEKLDREGEPAPFPAEYDFDYGYFVLKDDPRQAAWEFDRLDRLETEKLKRVFDFKSMLQQAKSGAPAAPSPRG